MKCSYVHRVRWRVEAPSMVGCHGSGGGGGGLAVKKQEEEGQGSVLDPAEIGRAACRERV